VASNDAHGGKAGKIEGRKEKTNDGVVGGREKGEEERRPWWGLVMIMERIKRKKRRKLGELVDPVRGKGGGAGLEVLPRGGELGLEAMMAMISGRGEENRERERERERREREKKEKKKKWKRRKKKKERRRKISGS